MEDQKTRVEKFEKFTWTIKDLSKLETKQIYSENFFIGGHPWRILMYPKGNDVNYLSIYLDAGDAANLPYEWSRYAEFKLALINQVYGKRTITKQTSHTFNARENDWGFTSYIPLAEFYDIKEGFIVNDTCKIEAMISVSNSEHAGNPPLPMEMSTDSIGELTDFRGLAKIDKMFVPLLDEVCSLHPSVIECQQKRSRRFTEWAFTALGRVLHFLKTKKVRDMNDEACNHLQILWEELETFRFDLSWLEPHIQSALGMKSYMERAAQVKSMKENVAAIEMEMKMLKEKMAATKVDLEIARRECVKAEAGFEERDLDVELGYGP